MSGVFDGEEMLERVGGDRELLAELVVLLREECERLVPTIRDAVRTEDAVGLEQAAHKLKGSVGQMAAGQAYETAKELEILGRQGGFESARPFSDRLGTEIDALLAALESFASPKEPT